MPHNQDPSRQTEQPNASSLEFLSNIRIAALATATALTVMLSSSERADAASTQQQGPGTIGGEAFGHKPKPGEKPADGRQTLECREIRVKYPDTHDKAKEQDSRSIIRNGDKIVGDVGSLVASFGLAPSSSDEKVTVLFRKPPSKTKQQCDPDPDRPSLPSQDKKPKKGVGSIGTLPGKKRTSPRLVTRNS